MTSIALVIGVAGAAAIEVLWWVQGASSANEAGCGNSCGVRTMGFLDKVKNLVSNADKVDTAIDKAGDVVDPKTQGKYASQVDKLQGAAEKGVDGTKARGALPQWRDCRHRSLSAAAGTGLGVCVGPSALQGVADHPPGVA